MGFDDHKQVVFSLVQALKTLFLYLQSNKETVEQYGWTFCALWETVEAFGGSPGIHQGMIEAMLKDPTRVANVGKPMGADASAGEASTTTTGSGDQASMGIGKQVNRAGDSHCYNSGKQITGRTNAWI